MNVAPAPVICTATLSPAGAAVGVPASPAGACASPDGLQAVVARTMAKARAATWAVVVFMRNSVWGGRYESGFQGSRPGLRHLMIFLLHPDDMERSHFCSQARDASRNEKAGPKARSWVLPEPEGSVVHVRRPVLLDLLHQRVRQRHIVERLGLGIAIGVDPAEEFLGVLGAG